MVRVLAPGGRLSLMASCGRAPGPVQRWWGARRVGGLRVFEHDEITGWLRDEGLTDVDQQVQGFAQFVQAVTPA